MKVTYWKDGKITTGTAKRFIGFCSGYACFVSKCEVYYDILRSDLISVETDDGKLISYLGVPRVIYGMDKVMKYKDLEPLVRQAEKDIDDAHRKTKDMEELKKVYNRLQKICDLRNLLRVED